MEEIQATPTKRKLDQVENVDPNPLHKKIKMNNSDEKKDIIFLPDLPPEIINCIPSFITDDHQRRHQRLVSRSWFKTINYNEFRIGALLASEAEEFSRIFNRYMKPIHIKFMKTSYFNSMRLDSPHHQLISAPLLIKVCRELTQLTGLDLRLNRYLLAEEHLNLQYLTLTMPIRHSNLMQMTNLKRLETSRIIVFDANQVMKFPPNLESLSLVKFTLKPTRFESNTHLTELEISEINMDLLKALPNLKRLKIMKCERNQANQIDVRDLVFPNLEELETNLNVPDLSSLTNLTKLLVHNGAIQLTPQLTKLKEIQCLGQVIFPENHQSLLQSLESFKVSNPNKTIINVLNSQKITQLSTALTKDNHGRFMQFTKLVDLELVLSSLVKPTPFVLPLLTGLCIQIYPQHYNIDWLSNLTTLEWLLIHRVTDFNEDLLEVHGLSKFQNLTHLFIGPALKNRSDLSQLTNLRQLGMFKGDENDDLQILTSLQKLTSLSISHNTSSIECLTKLSRLQELKLTSDNEEMCSQLAKNCPFVISWKELHLLNKIYESITGVNVIYI